MPNCKVKGCPIGNGWYRGPKHTLFQFPKNESILKEWKNRIGMPNLQVSEHTRVCSKHFEDEAFVPDEENVTSRGKKRATRQLKPSFCAIDELFTNFAIILKVPDQGSWD